MLKIILSFSGEVYISKLFWRKLKIFRPLIGSISDNKPDIVFIGACQIQSLKQTKCKQQARCIMQEASKLTIV